MPAKKNAALVVAEPPVQTETAAKKSKAVPKSVPTDAKAPAKVAAVKASKTTTKSGPKASAAKAAPKAAAAKADVKSAPGKAKSSNKTEKAAPPKAPVKGKKTKLEQPEEKVEVAAGTKTTAKAPSKANATTKKPVAVKISKPKKAPQNVPGHSTDDDETQPNSTKKLSFEAMILGAATALDDKKGSSMQAIKKQITTIYSVDITPQSSIHLKKGLDKLLEKGQLVRVSGSGLSGSFKLGKTTKPKKLVPSAPASTVPDVKPEPVRVDQITNGKPPAKSKPPAKPKAKPKKAPKVEVPTTSEEQVLKSLTGLQLAAELSSDSEGEINNSLDSDKFVIQDKFALTSQDKIHSEDDSISEHPESDEEEDWEKTEREEVRHEQSLFKNVTKLSDIPEVSYNSNLTDSNLVAASDKDDYDSSAATSYSNESVDQESEHKYNIKPLSGESVTSDESYAQDSNINPQDIEDSISNPSHQIYNPKIVKDEADMEDDSDEDPSYREGDEAKGLEDGSNGSQSEESSDDGDSDDESSEIEDDSEEEEEQITRIPTPKEYKLPPVNQNTSRLSDSDDGDFDRHNDTPRPDETSEFDGSRFDDNNETASERDLQLTDDEDMCDESAQNVSSYVNESNTEIIQDSLDEVVGDSTDFDDDDDDDNTRSESDEGDN